MTNSRTSSPPARPASVAAIAAGSCAALLAARLPTPPLIGAQAWLRFIESQGAVGTAITVVRAGAIAASAYVLLVALLALGLSMRTPAPWLGRVAHLVTVPLLRRLLPGVVGFGAIALSAGATAPLGGATPPPGPSTTVPMRPTPFTRTDGVPSTIPARTDDLLLLTSSSTDGADPSEDTDGGTATFRYVGPADSPPSTRSIDRSVPPSTAPGVAPSDRSTAVPQRRTTTPAGRPSQAAHADPRSATARSQAHVLPLAGPAVAVTPPRAPHPAPRVEPALHWTVARGDHLWHIAAATLAARRGRLPTDVETAGYWQRLIDQNRSTLVDPENPDLILPGQVIALPQG
jgi:hypothetical protein